MATIEQLYGALGQADAAGDTYAAENFAGRIKALKAAGVTDEEKLSAAKPEGHSLSMAEGMAQASQGLGDAMGETTIDRWNRESPAERKEDIRMAASVAAVPLAFTGIGLPAAAAIDTFANVGGDVLGSEVTGQDLKPIDLALDVGTGVAPLPIAAAFKRFSPITKAWLSYRVMPVSEATGAVQNEAVARGFVDEVPKIAEVNPAAAAVRKSRLADEGIVENDVPEITQQAPEKVSPKATDAEAKQPPAPQGIDAVIARDAELDQQLNEEAIRNYSSVLANSYMAKFLKPSETRMAGNSALEALNTYRGFTDAYRFDALPHAKTLDPSLDGLSYYEAQMRYDSPRMRAILERVESGEQGLEQELYDEIDNYRAERAAKAGRVVESMPVAKMRNLQEAAKEHRKLFDLLDVEGATAGKWTPVSKAERDAAEAGLQEALAPMAERFGADAKQYNDGLNVQWQEAHNAGRKNEATAIKMRMEAVAQMRDNIMALTGTLNRYGKVPKFKPLTSDQLTTYIAASDTHDIAKAGDALMREYDVINDWHNALPATRADNVTDKVGKKALRAAARAAGVSAGGLQGLVLTEAILPKAEAKIASVVRRIRRKELAKEIEQSVNKD